MDTIAGRPWGFPVGKALNLTSPHFTLHPSSFASPHFTLTSPHTSLTPHLSGYLLCQLEALAMPESASRLAARKTRQMARELRLLQGRLSSLVG